MSTATTLRPLPTPEELTEAERLLSVAHDEFEFIVGCLVGFNRSFESNIYSDVPERIAPEVMPTVGDVGRFYLFAHYLELRSQELHDMAEKIVAELPIIGEMPANMKLRADGEGRS